MQIQAGVRSKQSSQNVDLFGLLASAGAGVGTELLEVCSSRMCLKSAFLELNVA
jgi:hypothetical protein